MKIVMWIGDEPNQRALANKINSQFPISGIVLEKRVNNKKYNLKSIINKLLSKFVFSLPNRTWWSLMKHYESEFNSYPNCDQLTVSNINEKRTFDYTKKINPNLILVSGTSLIKEALIKINPKIGILNLHTGISPYIKGGPNCTNWCIALKQFEKIGNTIMWLDKGIDTGGILTTEDTKFNSTDNSLLKIHIRVMDHAHELYIRSIKSILSNKIHNIPQKHIGKGNTYYSKQWGWYQNFLVIMNTKKMIAIIKDGKLTNDKIKLIALPK
jgi:methionyl-tRNA formyltransferase